MATRITQKTRTFELAQNLSNGTERLGRLLRRELQTYPKNAGISGILPYFSGNRTSPFENGIGVEPSFSLS